MKNKSKISYVSPHILSDLPKDTPVLLAYSGGADSSALLHLLNEDAKLNGFSLHAAHFNHQIRGEEADRDAEFCRATCQKLDIPFHLGIKNIPALAKANGNSIEQEARMQRYAFFEKIMRENDIPILVTAHHSEDQIESIMLHILRGSGIAGLCGIVPCRDFANGLFLVRPILSAEKEEVLSYCTENNIAFVTDSTNSDTGYARNFIRAELTPRMRELQPNLSDVFERLSSSAVEANEFITDSALNFLKNEDKNSISLLSFNELHPALKSRVTALAFEEYSGGISLERTHLSSIIELCRKAEPHSSISLPDKIAAKIENNRLILVPEQRKNDAKDFTVPFTVGKTVLENGTVINVEKNPKEDLQNFDVLLDISCDIINDSTHFRSRTEGDVIFLCNMHKNIKKLISEKKIPLDLRKKLPLLVNGTEVLWVPTVAVCDAIKKSKISQGTDFYRISIKFEN